MSIWQWRESRSRSGSTIRRWRGTLQGFASYIFHTCCDPRAPAPDKNAFVRYIFISPTSTYAHLARTRHLSFDSIRIYDLAVM